MRTARDRRPKLARKILAISLAPLALFLVAVYMLYDLRPGLITSKLESLVVHGRMIAFSIQDSDDVPNGKLQWLIGSSSLNRHYRESRSAIRL